MVKNLCQCRRCKKHHFDPWVRKIPWRRKWHPTLVFLPGKSHRQSPCGRMEWMWPSNGVHTLPHLQQLAWTFPLLWSVFLPSPITAWCVMCCVCACLLSISFPLKRTMHRITHTCSAWAVHSCPYNSVRHEADMQWFWMTEMFHFKALEMGKAFAPVTWDLLCSYLGLLFREKKKSQRGRVLWIKWMIY